MAGVGKVLDGALVARTGGTGLESIEGAQVDRFETVATIGDPVRQASESAGVRRPFVVQAAQDVDLDRATGQASRNDHEGGLVDIVNSGLAIEGDIVGQFDPQCFAARDLGGDSRDRAEY